MVGPTASESDSAGAKPDDKSRSIIMTFRLGCLRCQSRAISLPERPPARIRSTIIRSASPPPL